jgi:hypothetical protein
MPRTILIGDVHGCRSELSELLNRVGFVSGDRVVMVGDLVVRGPDPCGTLDLLLDIGARSVRGNHEDRLLRHHQAGLSINPTTKKTVRALKKRHWEWLASFPYWLDLPEHDVRVVHAGLVPGIAMRDQDPSVLMYVRSFGRAGQWSEEGERAGHKLWGETYAGSPHVVFGHNARTEPQIHEAATGLDTACVYGGRLTAMVLRENEMAPPARERRDVLVSVPAKRAYYSRT